MGVQPRGRRVETEQIGDVTVVTLTDKRILDDDNIRVIGEQLFGLVDDQGQKNLILNFTNVELFSSAALGKFITTQKKCRNAGGKVVLCGMVPGVYEVFEMTRQHKEFNIQKDEQAALQAF